MRTYPNKDTFAGASARGSRAGDRRSPADAIALSAGKTLPRLFRCRKAPLSLSLSLSFFLSVLCSAAMRNGLLPPFRSSSSARLFTLATALANRAHQRGFRSARRARITARSRPCATPVLAIAFHLCRLGHASRGSLQSTLAKVLAAPLRALSLSLSLSLFLSFCLFLSARQPRCVLLHAVNLTRIR
jgi:hypothetical protein